MTRTSRLEFVFVELQGMAVLVPSKCTDSCDDDDSDDDKDNFCPHCSWGLIVDLQARWFLLFGC